jgi:cell division protein FtsB
MGPPTDAEAFESLWELLKEIQRRHGIALAAEKARAGKAEADLAQERKRHEGTLNLLMAKDAELAALRQRVEELTREMATMRPDLGFNGGQQQ